MSELVEITVTETIEIAGVTEQLVITQPSEIEVVDVGTQGAAGPGFGTASVVTFVPTGNLAATDVQAALVELDSEKQAVSGKDASGGYAGLTLFKLNLRNAANTITSWFTSAATVARTWTMPDKDGTVAMTSDITGTNSGTNTGDQTSIVGITGTLAEFNTAVTDADFASLAGAETLTNKTLEAASLTNGYTEEEFAVTGTTPALSPTNGSIQTWTLSGASTPTAGTWAAGQSMTLMVDDGTAYTVTWTSLAVTWKTGAGVAPTLNTTGLTAIALWKVGTTIYGARVGDA